MIARCQPIALFTHLREDAVQRYLGESRRVLRDGGCLIASIHMVPEAGRRYSGDEFRADMQPDYFAELARRAGFGDSRVVGDICGQETFVFTR